jgi:hypothetical protein
VLTVLLLLLLWGPAGLVTLLTHVDFVKGASKQCINGKLVLPVSCYLKTVSPCSS